MKKKIKQNWQIFSKHGVLDFKVFTGKQKYAVFPGVMDNYNYVHLMKASYFCTPRFDILHTLSYFAHMFGTAAVLC